VVGSEKIRNAFFTIRFSLGGHFQLHLTSVTKETTGSPKLKVKFKKVKEISSFQTKESRTQQKKKAQFQKQTTLDPAGGCSQSMQ
jgi:hypothetical protein